MDLNKGPTNLERYMRAYRMDLENIHNMVPVMYCIWRDSTPEQRVEIEQAVMNFTIAQLQRVCLVTDPGLTYCGGHTNDPVKTHWEDGERHCLECEQTWQYKRRANG